LEDLEADRYFSILYFLDANNGCTQQHICNHLAVDKTAMVKVINYLVECGYVLRQRNPLDRREHIITLTKKGESSTKKIVKKFNALDRLLFTKLADPERKKLEEGLEKLTEVLKELPANDLFFSYSAKNSKRTKK